MIDSWYLHLHGVAGASDRTKEIYLDAVRWLAGRLPHTIDDWTQVDHTHLRAFFAELADLGYSKSYRNQVGRSLQQWFGWLSIEEDVPNPFGPKLKPPPAPKLGESPAPIIAIEHLAALITDCERGRTFEDRRDAAILRLLAATGSRLAEIAGMAIADVSLAAREVTITGKANKTRIARCDPKCALAIDRYLRMRAKHRYAAQPAMWLGIRRRKGMTADGIYQMVRRRGARLGLDIHPHLFRHTFAHRWLDAGGAEGDLMELLGWTSPQMLRHYGASARGARARRAYDRVNVLDGV